MQTNKTYSSDAKVIPSKQAIVTDTAVALIQFIQAHEGDLHLLPGLLDDLKTTAMMHGVTHKAADGYCSDVEKAVTKLWRVIHL